jgi:hypothetical protein
MAAEGMSSSEQSLVFGFLLNALIRTEKGNVLRAGRRASLLLRRVLDRDEAALEEVAILCNAADNWQGWRDSSSQVRSALSQYVARGGPAVESKGPVPPVERAEAEAKEALTPTWLAEYERRFGMHETIAALEATAQYALLDAWSLETSRSLAEFFDLWEPAPDPED